MALAACGDDGGAASESADGGGTGQTRIENYLRSNNFTKLVLEVDYVDGYAPLDEAEQELLERIRPVVDKPDGIEIVRDEKIVSRGEDHEWTFAELQQVAGETNNLSVGSNTLKMHVLFVDGHYAEDSSDSKVLGVAWANENITIFKKTIRSNCQGPLGGDRLCRYAEASIWTHEVGHVLGLVDNGVPVQSNHHDVEHGHHCNRDSCVMYYAYEGTKVMDVIRDRLGGGEATLDFGPDCKADLQAVRDGN